MARANAQYSATATQFHARKHGMKLYVAAVDPEPRIVWDPNDRFSPTYINALFEHGFQRGMNHLPWNFHPG
ncbi:MAG: hypothetical protein ACOH2H_06795 [Cypionkella sp.]